jgi:hypothetical protein
MLGLFVTKDFSISRNFCNDFYKFNRSLDLVCYYIRFGGVTDWNICDYLKILLTLILVLSYVSKFV